MGGFKLKPSTISSALFAGDAAIPVRRLSKKPKVLDYSADSFPVERRWRLAAS